MKKISGSIFIALVFLVTIGLSAPDFQFSLPNYTYHKFDNGFELILVENHTNPLIASIVVVRTGLRNETAETNGISHMLEHMTFNGTDKRTQKELYDELDFYGIYLNAQTSEDYTTYMALNHRDHIDKALDIMSDMLFHSTFPAQKFEKEKGIIAEEIRKDSESPDFQKEQSLRKAFYREPPYSLPVIGTVETVKNMTRQQVADYYHTYYSPNNMIAILVGDFDSKTMLKEVKQYFGNQKPKNVPAHVYHLSQTFPFTYQETNHQDKVIYLKFPAPVFYSNDYIPFRLFYDDALSDEEGVILKKMRENSSLKIKKISANYEFHPEFGVLTLTAVTAPEIQPEQILSAFRNELTILAPSADNLNVLKREQAIHEILQGEKILYYGFLKAQELAVGGVDAFSKTIPAIMECPAVRVNSLIKKYPHTWQNPSTLFGKGNWVTTIHPQKYLRTKTVSAKSVSQIYRKVLKNGITVIQLQNNDNPVLALHFLFKNRAAWEPQGEEGIADFLHHALFKASKKYPAADLSKQLKEIGAEIKAYDWDFVPYDDYYNVPQYSYIRFLTLDQFFDTAMELTADNILHPSLDSVFDQVKARMSFLAGRKTKSARAMARLNYQKMLFGKDHPLARLVSGTPESIRKITLPDLQNFHKRYFSANNLILTVVSGLDSARVFAAVDHYFGEMPVAENPPEIGEIPLTTSTATDSMEIGSRQAYIYLGYTFSAPLRQAPAMRVMNQMLSNQIAFSLREQKGWAYRLGSSISRWKNHFYFTAMIGTGRQTTHPAIRGLFDEIKKFKTQEITADMIQRTKNSILAALVRRRASRESQAFTLGVNEFYGYPPDYYFSIYDQIKNVSGADIKEARANYLKTAPYRLFYTIPAPKSGGGKQMRGQMPPRMPH